ncbi:MAG: LysR substrate-binding domain-containing protein, partial [Gammaproteobacteria bacterium]
MDKLQGMKVFLEVARLGSFSAAAAELKMSKAMASKHVSQLENNLGARLINRTTRNLNLTEAGAAYRDRVREILNEIGETERAVTRLTTEPRGTLRIRAPMSFGSFHLPRAIPGYQRLHPEVSFELELTDRVPDFVEEGIDLAIIAGKLENSSLVARKLATTRFVVCASAEYLEIHGIPQVPQDLQHHNCLQFTYRQPPDTWVFRGTKGEYPLKVGGTLKANVGDAIRIA